MKAYVRYALILALALPGLAPQVRAQAVAGAPAFVDYQGTVYDGTITDKPLGSSGTSGNYIAAPANYTMQFKIYDAQTGGNLIWAETQTVTVSLGSFSVRLGSGAAITSPTSLPHGSLAGAFNGKDRYLELTVVIPPAASGTPIIPRLAFQSSPFSFVAQRAVLADSVNGVVNATAGSTFNGMVTGNVTGSVTGNLAGDVTGNLTGNVTGNLTGGVTGNVTGNVTGTAANVTGIVAIPNGGTGSATKNFVDLSTDQTSIGGKKGFTGYVGIGTTDPKAQLHVVKSGYVAGHKWTGPDTVYGIYLGGNSAYYGYDNYNTGADNGSVAYSAIAGLFEGNLICKDYLYIGNAVTNSDRRAKNVVGASDGATDLATMLKLQVTDYTWIDRTKDQHRPHKMLVAQDVEKVFPQAVTINPTPQMIPSVYEMAETVLHDASAGTLTITTGKAHGFQPGDKIDLFADKEEMKAITVKAVTSPREFIVTSERAFKNVFVYGKEVNDFRGVDYEAIAMLNVSATQQIKREKDAEIAALREENSKLRAKLEAQEQRLVGLEAKDHARDAKLAAIEALLATDKPAVRTVSIKTSHETE